MWYIPAVCHDETDGNGAQRKVDSLSKLFTLFLMLSWKHRAGKCPTVCWNLDSPCARLIAMETKPTLNLLSLSQIHHSWVLPETCSQSMCTISETTQMMFAESQSTTLNDTVHPSLLILSYFCRIKAILIDFYRL